METASSRGGQKQAEEGRGRRGLIRAGLTYSCCVCLVTNPSSSCFAITILVLFTSNFMSLSTYRTFDMAVPMHFFAVIMQYVLRGAAGLGDGLGGAWKWGGIHSCQRCLSGFANRHISSGLVCPLGFTSSVSVRVFARWPPRLSCLLTACYDEQSPSVTMGPRSVTPCSGASLCCRTILRVQGTLRWISPLFGTNS